MLTHINIKILLINLLCSSIIGFGQTHFDSLNFEYKSEYIKNYIDTSKQHPDNHVNLFILKFNNFFNFCDSKLYVELFEKTSFREAENSNDSLFSLFMINLNNHEIKKAEETLHLMDVHSNDLTTEAYRLLSDVYKELYWEEKQAEKREKYAEKSLIFYKKYFVFDSKKHQTIIEQKKVPYKYTLKVHNYFVLLELNQKYNDIISYSDSVLNYQPENTVWLERKAHALEYTDKLDEALNIRKLLFNLTTDSFSDLKNLLRIYLKTGDTLSLINLLNEQTSSIPKDIQLHHYQLETLNKLGFYQDKKTLIDKVLAQEPSFYEAELIPELFYYYSIFLTYNSQYKKAEKQLKKAITLATQMENKNISFEPFLHDVYKYYISNADKELLLSKYYEYLSRIYTFKKRTKRKSIKYNKKSLHYYSCNPISLNNLARIYHYSTFRSKSRAVSYYNQLIDCNTFGWGDFNVHSQLGSLYYYKLKDFQNAKKHLHIALEKTTPSAEDYYLLSQIYAYEKKYDIAITMIDQAIASCNDDVLIEIYKSKKNALTENK